MRSNFETVGGQLRSVSTRYRSFDRSRESRPHPIASAPSFERTLAPRKGMSETVGKAVQSVSEKNRKVKEDGSTDFGDEISRRSRLEAVLFLSKEPLNTRKIAQLANLADGTDARTLVRQLNKLYDETGRSFRIEEIAGGLQLRTRPQFASWLRRLGHIPQELRLSTPAIETLAVVAYRQPVIRADVEAVRGVSCGEILRQLMERELVRVNGRSEELGRPYLYGTTKQFLQVFGLRSLDELPRAGVFRQSLVDNSSHQSQAGHDSKGIVDPTHEGVLDVNVIVEDSELENPGNEIAEDRLRNVVRADEEWDDDEELDDDELDDDEELDDEELDDEELGDDEEWDDDDEELEDEELEDEELEEDDADDEDEELGEDEEWVYEDDEDEELEDDDDLEDDDLADDEEWVEVEDDEELEDDDEDDEELGDDEEWVYEDDDDDELEDDAAEDDAVEDWDDEEDDDAAEDDSSLSDELGEDEEWEEEDDAAGDDDELGEDEEWEE